MQNIETLEELERRLTDIVRGPGKNTAIIGGHYPINMSGEAETYSDGAFGVFPEYTFGLASRLVAKARENQRNVKIALVVDDHSLMTPQMWYREQGEGRHQVISKAVSGYFDKFSLPENYRLIMTQNRLGESDLVRASPEVVPFQESAFRLAAERENGIPVTCAGEYKYILRSLQQQGVERVISLIPQRCQGPTCQGAEKFRTDQSNLKITHAYLSSDPTITSAEELQDKITSDGGIPLIAFG